MKIIVIIVGVGMW